MDGFLLILLLLVVMKVVVDARSISSEDLAIGEWNLRLKCDHQFYESELFPPTIHRPFSDTTNNNKSNNKDIRRKASQQHCRLVLYPNGSFLLEPAVISPTKGQLVPESESILPRQILPVRGRWKLNTSPYCATDRFYDGLVLSSYPRVQKKLLVGNENTLRTDNKNEQQQELRVLKRLHFHFRCRLHGRFSREGGGLVRRLLGLSGQYTRGRITHGTLLRLSDEREDDNSKDDETTSSGGALFDHVPSWWKKAKRRRVMASFSAKRHPFDPTVLDLDNETD